MQNLFRAEMLRVQKTLDADEENIFRIEKCVSFKYYKPKYSLEYFENRK